MSLIINPSKGLVIGTPVVNGTHLGILYVDASGLLASSTRFQLDNSNTQISFGDGSWLNESGGFVNLANEIPGGGVNIFADNTAGSINLSGNSVILNGTTGEGVQFLGECFSSNNSHVSTISSPTDGWFGIYTNSPRHIFDIHGFYTIGNETSGSISFTYNDPDNDGHYIASGDTYGARIYAYYDSPVGRVYSASYYQITPQTDNGSSDPMEIHISWGAVTNASGYIVLMKDPQYMGSNYDACADVGSVTSIILGGTADTEDTFGGLFAFPSSIGANLYVDENSGELVTTGPLNINTSAVASGYVDAQAVVKNPSGAGTFRFEGQDYAKLEWRANHSGTTNTSAMQIYVRNDGTNPPFIHWGLLNDAEGSEATFLNCYRSGISPTTVEWGGTQTGLSGKTSPTAKLHLGAGTTAASTAPLKFTSGTNMTTAEAGAMEYTTPDLFFTPGSATRYNLPLSVGAGTQGDLLYASGASIYSRLGKDTNSTRYLSNQGTSNNPSWNQVNLSNGVTGTLPVANGGTGSTVKNQDNVALTNQSADITTTNFSSGGVAGTYRVSYSLQDTTSDLTAGAVTLTIAYTDGAGATTTTANQVLTGTGRVSGSIYLQLASGNVTYATSHTGIFGSAKYALYLTLERLS